MDDFSGIQLCAADIGLRTVLPISTAGLTYSRSNFDPNNINKDVWGMESVPPFNAAGQTWLPCSACQIQPCQVAGIDAAIDGWRVTVFVDCESGIRQRSGSMRWTCAGTWVEEKVAHTP